MKLSQVFEVHCCGYNQNKQECLECINACIDVTANMIFQECQAFYHVFSELENELGPGGIVLSEIPDNQPIMLSIPYYVNGAFAAELALKLILHFYRIPYALGEGHRAQFVYHLECAQTGYRKVIQTIKKAERIVVSNKDVCGKMQICPFIVATEDILGYSNDFFHEDYSGVTFDIEAGCVMALGKQANVTVEKELDDLANVPSIFAIIFNANPNDTHMITSIDNQRITILLPSNDYTNYKALNQNARYQPLLISLVVVPALVYALEEVKARPFAERYEWENYGWYRTIRKVLQNKFNCDIESATFDSKNMLELAQKLIDEPMHEALRVLANSSGNGEEGEA